MEPPRSGPSSPVTLSPEQPEAEAEAEQDRRVAEMEARLAEEAAAHRLEMQRLNTEMAEMRRERQMKEQVVRHLSPRHLLPTSLPALATCTLHRRPYPRRSGKSTSRTFAR